MVEIGLSPGLHPEHALRRKMSEGVFLMQLVPVLVICAACLALAFAVFNYFAVKKLPEGTQQMSEISGAMKSLFGLDPLVTGIILAVIVAVVILGGVKRIGTVTSYMVPFMSVFYILAGIAVIILRFTSLPSAAATASIFL